MDPALRHWINAWDDLDERFWAVVAWAERSLSPTELAWKPAPTVASIGFNLMHLGEMLDYYLHYAFGYTQVTLKGELPTMRRGAQDPGTYDDLDTIVRYHKRLRPAYRRYLESLELQDLDRPIFGGRRNIGWAIAHIHEHESYHIGKCMLLRALLPQGT